MELEELSVVEKAAMLSGGSEWDSRGNDRADIPSFVMSDGPHGVRRQLGEGDHLGIGASKPATCFPTAGTVANSWDPALAEEMGEALGSEAHDLDVNVLLGPGLNIKRNPLCGRNFEYYSEDPIVAGRMAAGLIRGIQSNGISACPKHFAVNSQELRRMAYLLQMCSNNLNQYAKRANECGKVYAADMEDLRQRLDELIDIGKQILSKLAEL